MTKLKVLTQNIGIDVAKDSFVACLSYLLFDREIKFVSVQNFKNNSEGFTAFSDWFKRYLATEADLYFTMEATGVYYEHLAYYLFGENYQVSVVQATQASNYKKSESQSSKTDKLDAKSLSRMGLERKLSLWKPTSEYYLLLRDLTRERSALIKDKTRLRNQIHALNHSMHLHPLRKELIEERIGLIKSQIKTLDKKIKHHLTKESKDYQDVSQKIKNVLSIPGVGHTVVATVVAETDGFAKTHSVRQLISYAALSIDHSESGDMKGKSKMKKKGNKHIKGVLFCPAFSSIRVSEDIRAFYDRVAQGRNGRAATLAVCRKVLTLIYTLWKNNTSYDSNYIKKGATSCPS